MSRRNRGDARRACENDQQKKPHWGTTLDEFLDKEGIPGAAMAEIVIGMLAWQLSLEM